MLVDWGKRADYTGARHGVSADWADEAVDERNAVWQVPDPASQSGLSVRVIGYSPSARAVLTVIFVSADTDPGGVSNQQDQILYREEQQE